MFKLRKEHLDAFETQVVRLFASRALAHVKAVWPAECRELGDPALTQIIAAGIQRAAALGFSVEHDVIRFIDLNFLLAKDFESNPLASWTKPILADRALASTAKMDRLYQRMEEEFKIIEKRKARTQ